MVADASTPRRHRPRRLVAIVVLVVAAGCADSAGEPAAHDSAVPRTATASVERLTVEVLAEHPHDTGAFTQGLLLDADRLFESTGLEGESTLREVDPTSGEILRSRPVPEDDFAEGLALVDDRLVQLTWRDGVARVYDRETFEQVDEHRYEGEGWGLCHDGERLVMSDGSATLTFRDPATFEATGSVEVTFDGTAVPRLNELECVDGLVYANVFRSHDIVVIDPSSGAVTAVVDASDLVTDDRESREVLNGIAHVEDDRFYLTGKNWPTLYDVRLVPQD